MSDYHRSFLHGLLMPDEVPTGDKAVYLFLEILAFCFALASVDALVARHWRSSAVYLLVALLFFVAGIKWSQIKHTILRRKADVVPIAAPPAPSVAPFVEIMTFQPPSAQEKLAELELKQRETEIEIRAFAKALCQWVDAAKKRTRKTNLAFSEELLTRDAMPGYGGSHLPAVLDLLRKEGRARPADSPGWWFID